MDLYARYTVVHERVTVAEAAARLGVSEGAIRQRINRGTLESEKDENGRVYVLLYADDTESHAEEYDASYGVQQDALERLVESLEQQNAYLREQLAEERAANRENRRLLAAALERIPPQLESPRDTFSEPRNGPVSASEEPSGTSAPPEEERRSWWRRFFGY